MPNLLNRVTNTGIVARDYNSRGLITHNADTRPLVRQSDGTLWAAIKENSVPNFCNLYRSTDEGFSWEKVWTGNFAVPNTRKVGLGDQNTNGPHLSLHVYEHLDLLVLWQSYWDTSLEVFLAEPFSWRLSAPGTRLTDSPFVSSVATGADSLALDVPYNDAYTWLVFTASNKLIVKQMRPQYQLAVEGTFIRDGLFFDVFQAVGHAESYVDIAILEEVLVPPSYALRHVRYWAIEGVFDPLHTIHAPGDVSDITDVGIARDGTNNLCCTWSQGTPTGDNMDAYYSISRDGGETWLAPIKIAKEIGHSVWRDPATARLAVRTRVLGGRHGFMLSYVHQNPSVMAKTFVRTLLSDDGITYTLGAQQEVASQTGALYPVTGLSWFRPPSTNLLDLSDPGQVRVGYTIGEGNSRIQIDSVPVRIGQELLYESAYPSSLPSESGTYETTGANAIQLQAKFNVLGAPNTNVDYYNLQLVGHATRRYEAAFKKIGTFYRFQRFDPITDAEMDDRSAYWAPVEFTSLAVLDPQSYEFPTMNQRGGDSFTTVLERDVRKLFLPPTLHLSRAFLVNKGNFLKRTIWVVSFDGNEYEVSQVVPYFINSQIAYYGANAFVIGASNDPFSRLVLPSET